MGIYDELGVARVINAWGTVTAVGGSLMAPEVLDAMREAAGAFVDLHLLQRRAGERIAELLGVDAACVTSGAAAGLTLAAAGCMTRRVPTRRTQLPVTTGLADECLVLPAHRNRYDVALTLSGIRIVEVGPSAEITVDQVRAAVTDRTAMFLYVAESSQISGSLPFGVVARAMRERDVPVVVDAAAELPPRTEINRYLADGADLLVLSGGKEIRGPQSSGLILGDHDLVSESAAHAFPNHGIGRGMKTDKETIAGLVKAVEIFVDRERDERDRCERVVADIVAALGSVDHLKVRRHRPASSLIRPVTIPRAYITPLLRSVDEVVARLRDGDPAIAVGTDGPDVAINPQCLELTDVPILVGAIVAAASC